MRGKDAIPGGTGPHLVRRARAGLRRIPIPGPRRNEYPCADLVVTTGKEKVANTWNSSLHGRNSAPESRAVPGGLQRSPERAAQAIMPPVVALPPPRPHLGVVGQFGGGLLPVAAHCAVPAATTSVSEELTDRAVRAPWYSGAHAVRPGCL
ncbi:hypothetical protein GCM10027074_65500 [Streptomyces deserti]